MDRTPKLPPLYQPHRLSEPDAHLAAVEAARAGAEAASFYWVDRTDALDCAVVLRPDGSTRHPALVAYAGMVAVGDALGSLLPEQAPVAFEWPDRILVNDGCLGGTRLSLAPRSIAAGVPEWAVWSVLLALEADPLDEPGHHPEVTTLGDEFAYDELFSAADLLEAVARYFLRWVTAWQEDGFAPVRRAWIDRALGHHEKAVGRRVFWRVEAIDDDGAVTMRRDAVRRILTIEQGMKARSWWLPDRFGAYKPLVERDAADDRDGAKDGGRGGG